MSDLDLPNPEDGALAEGEAELLEERLRQAVRLVPEALQEEFCRTPGDIAYWAARHAQAIGAALRATARRKKLHGLLRIRARQELEQEMDAAAANATEEDEAKPSVKVKRSGRQQVTESMVDARVETYAKWQEVQDAEIEAEVARERMRGAVEAMRARRDMLIQLGANQRAELEGDPIIRQRIQASRGRDE